MVYVQILLVTVVHLKTHFFNKSGLGNKQHMSWKRQSLQQLNELCVLSRERHPSGLAVVWHGLCGLFVQSVIIVKMDILNCVRKCY